MPFSTRENDLDPEVYREAIVCGVPRPRTPVSRFRNELIIGIWALHRTVRHYDGYYTRY